MGSAFQVEIFKENGLSFCEIDDEYVAVDQPDELLDSDSLERGYEEIVEAFTVLDLNVNVEPPENEHSVDLEELLVERHALNDLIEDVGFEDLLLDEDMVTLIDLAVKLKHTSERPSIGKRLRCSQSTFYGRLFCRDQLRATPYFER